MSNNKYKIPENSNFTNFYTQQYSSNINYQNIAHSFEQTSENESGSNFDLDSEIKIPISLYKKLEKLGIIDKSGIREYNIGKSNYSQKLIQPWVVWNDYPELTSWDHDIIKRVLRTKEGEDRKMDYEKIIHDCKERIRQLNLE